MMWVTMWAILLVLCGGALAVRHKPPQNGNRIYAYDRLGGHKFKNVGRNEKMLFANDDNTYRLPNTTKPVHYNIWWKTDIAPPILQFSGTVDIDLQATQPDVNQIVIHSLDLNIESVTLQLDDNIINQTYFFDIDHQFLIVNLTTESLEYCVDDPVYYTLSISFNAPLRTDMIGLYRSWYWNFGKINWMATSQFGLTYARAAFPCYDEPALKATFDVTITRQQDFNSWSNMRRKETRASDYDGYEDDLYYTTPVMSTYLLAIIVTEYDSLAKTETVNGTEEVVFEVIARPEAIRTGQGDYMFELGQTLFEALSEYTDIDYYSINENMKMTHAAIPDFGAGAMENWGLITYREDNLMYGEDNTDNYDKQNTASSLTHESSHQWFGDLVTLDWWDASWLNEGFATYFEYYITDKFTDMGYATRFIIEQVQNALLEDSFDDPQPLTTPGVGSPDSVAAMFSDIYYSKGAAVIRMTEHLMGYDNHQYGLRKYLKARAYQTARPMDLFENLQEAALETGAIDKYGPDFSIIDYYQSWTDQGGHPILTVDVDRESGAVTINQRQFNIDSQYTTPKMNWIIPITYATASNPDFLDTKPTHIIRDVNTTLDLDIGADEWIILNKQQTGFYRLNYDEQSWDLITKLLHGPDREMIHVYNRAQIVDDVFQFARAGIMTYNRAFNILSFLKNETEYDPWLAAENGFGTIVYRLMGSPLEKPVKDLFMEWASNIMTDLTYYPIEGEPFLRTDLRLTLAPKMCYYGNEECITTARNVFEDFYNWGIEIPINMRGWVECNALRVGNPNYYNILYNRYFYHPVNNEQYQILTLLGCTADEASLMRLLDAIITENFVFRDQDYETAFDVAVGINDDNVMVAFRYIQNNLQAVAAKFGSFTTPLSYVTTYLKTEDQVKQFQDWATENKDVLGDSYQDIFDAANGTLDRLSWAASVYDDINSYLTQGDTPVRTGAINLE